jgi:WD40 repeat protein
MDLYRKLKGQKFTWIACGTGNHSVRLWKAEGQAPDDLYLVDKPSKMIVIDVSFSPNGQYLAAIDRNCFIVIWSFVSNTPNKVFSERLSQKDALYKSLNWNSSGTKLAVANLDQEVLQ